MEADKKVDPADKRQYLVFIQNNVTRMAGNCVNLKKWIIPILAAVYGFAVQMRDSKLACIGIGINVIFTVMDARYLTIERAYRMLYQRAAEDNTTLWDMNYSVQDDTLRWFLRSLRSWSVLPFYGVLLLCGIAIALFAC